MEKEIAGYDFSIKRLIRIFFLTIQAWPIWPGKVRAIFLRLGGIQIEMPTFVGSGVYFDTLRPDYIIIGKGAVITAGTRILTHYFSPNDGYYYFGRVKIGQDCFIGVNTLIVNSVIIGNKAVIGAGSVVTKDIPGGEVWAGNPAHFIRKRELPINRSFK